jgi:uncharacterized membrane protein
MRRDGVYILGHRVHQTGVVLPVGALVFAAFFDILYLATDSPTWAVISFWMIAAGVVTGLFAALFGFLDWLRVEKGTRAKRVGALHGIGNVIVVSLFAISWLIRRDAPAAPETIAIVLGLSGFALAGVTAWLGGELVARLGIGVYDDANPNAPSSLAAESKPHRVDAPAGGRRVVVS